MPNPDGTPTPHEKARHEHKHPDKHHGSYCINPHSTSLPTIHSNPFLVSLFNTNSGHSAGGNDSKETEKDNNETNHTQRRKLKARKLRSPPMYLVLPMVDTLHRTMQYPPRNIHRFIKDWYKYSASETEQNQFVTKASYRTKLIQTFAEQMKAQEELIDDMAKRCARNANRSYGQARNIAELVVTRLEPQERVKFNQNQRLQALVELRIFNRLVKEPHLDGNAVNDKEN